MNYLDFKHSLPPSCQNKNMFILKVTAKLLTLLNFKKDSLEINENVNSFFQKISQM